MSLPRKLTAEFLGTFVLVLGGCGTAVFAAPVVGILGVALAFGLTVVCMAYAVGHVSGGHFNPAVTLGLFAAGRTSGLDVGPYILAQVAGAILAGGLIYFILMSSGIANVAPGDFASNGFGDHSPAKFGLTVSAVAEFVLTAVFLLIITGATSAKAPPGFAPLAIGLALTLIHLISIPITNTSVNPARSTGVAIFADPWALQQLWLFWVAPLAGGVVGGLIGRFLFAESDE